MFYLLINIRGLPKADRQAYNQLYKAMFEVRTDGLTEIRSIKTQLFDLFIQR